MEMTMASMKMRDFIWSADGLFGRMRPGRAAPRVIEIWFANTDKNMTPGMLAGVNQFTDTFTAELSTNKFPNAAKNDPIKQNSGSPVSRIVLTQTPAITNTDPKKHPTLLPYLSSMKLAGKAPIGCRMVKINALAVTIYLE